MHRLVFYILLIMLAEAPVFSGASAQSVDTPRDSLDISALMRILSATGENQDSLSSEQIVEFPDGSQIKTPDAAGILDLIITGAAVNKKRKHQKKQASSASVLNFLTGAYAEHGFYQSGHWDDAEDWTSVTRNVTLPDYDPSDFFRPVWGRVTSGYGFRPKFGRIHKGIDLSLNVGDTVRAALPGVVAKVSYDPGGYGNYVVVVHNNGMETRYAHLLSPLSLPGEMLDAGDPLGLGGNSGNSTGPHLHFEVRYRGTALDPASIFSFHLPAVPPFRAEKDKEEPVTTQRDKQQKKKSR